MYWDRLTSQEIDRLDRNLPVIMLIAATEQHGPHLPLATDHLIGSHFLTELEREIPEKILILPGQVVGCSNHHMDFAGTLSLSHDTMASVVEDVLSCVLEHGFTRVILFNSHGGNKGIAQVINEHLGPEFEYFLTVTWWQLASKALQDICTTGPGGTGHAGEFETSLMLAIDPSLVHLDSISQGQNQKTFSWADGDMLQAPSVSLYRSMYEMTPNGVFGDPTQSSAEQGRKITKLIVTRMRQIIADLAKRS